MPDPLSTIDRDSLPVLPDSVPVAMPALPISRAITTLQQFKAVSDATRSRILGIIQHQPATAKQLADRLGAAPGAIGHHLHVLEEAGLAQVVARRVTRGIIANYYTRTARIFSYELPPEVAGEPAVALHIINRARDELAASLADQADDPYHLQALPHIRLSPERARHYYERIQALEDELLREPPDADGDVYGVMLAMFRSPAYVQNLPADATTGSLDNSDGGDACNNR